MMNKISKSTFPVVKAFCAWLETQQEVLDYDLGQQSGRREVILAGIPG